MNPAIQFSKHTEYQQTGVPWLGDIPAHWELKRNKHLFIEQKATVGKNAANYTLLSLTLKGVIARDMDNPQGKFPAEFNTYKIVQPDDLIFCLFDIEETPRTIGRAQQNGMITGAYTVMQCQPEISARYLSYYYLSLDNDKRLKPLYTGLRKVIQRETFMAVKSPLPPHDEQQRIANFLDQKITEVDEAIAKKQRLIELLKEQKTILINQAVTKGLNPDAPMRDSGVEWIGEVPEHWGVKKLKYVAGNFMYGTSVDCNTEEDGTPVLRIPNISKGHLILDDLKFTRLPKREENRYLLKNDDILIVRTNGNPQLVGKSALIKVTRKCMFASYLIRVVPNKNIDPIFLSIAMSSESVQSYLTHSARTSAGNYNLNTQSLGDAYIAYPPKDEQLSIVKHVENIRLLFADLLEKVSKEVRLLAEYKVSVVSRAVTGKIKL